MQIVLNGNVHQTDAQTLSELVVELGLVGQRIAIELDQQLIPKSRHASTVLHDGVRLEIVHAVGGG